MSTWIKRALLAAVLIPVVELVVWLWLWNQIGFFGVTALALGGAVIGGWLAKREGLKVLGEWRASVRNGRAPTAGALDALLVLAGAALLILPGVVSDLFGLVLLIPAVRRRLAVRLRAAGTVAMRAATPDLTAFAVRRIADDLGDVGDVIDVKGERVDEDGAQEPKRLGR